MMIGLLQGRAEVGPNRIVKPHFYAFGGVMATAGWLRSVVDGNFELQADSDKFTVNG
jgi:hypothetical protein